MFDKQYSMISRDSDYAKKCAEEINKIHILLVSDVVKNMPFSAFRFQLLKMFFFDR